MEDIEVDYLLLLCLNSKEPLSQLLSWLISRPCLCRARSIFSFSCTKVCIFFLRQLMSPRSLSLSPLTISRSSFSSLILSVCVSVSLLTISLTTISYLGALLNSAISYQPISYSVLQNIISLLILYTSSSFSAMTILIWPTSTSKRLFIVLSSYKSYNCFLRSSI